MADKRPSFCASCLCERKHLNPHQQQSRGATRCMRTVWLCLDCDDTAEEALKKGLREYYREMAPWNVYRKAVA